MELFSKQIQFFILFFIIFCASCSGSDNAMPGYIEGEYTYIASGVAGTLENLYVTRGQTVKKGDLLYQLELEPEQAHVDATKANIASLHAQLIYAQAQLERQKRLYPKNVTSAASVDQAQADFDSKAQQLAANQAELVQTKWSLQQKTVYAPTNGEVFDTFYRTGEKVPENRPVLALLAPQHIQVLFYVPETLLSKLKLKQPIEFSCDNCNGKTQATISYISPTAEYTPPVIYSKDTRYKLVYLIRAAMPDTVATHFHPGQPIDVYLPR